MSQTSNQAKLSQNFEKETASLESKSPSASRSRFQRVLLATAGLIFVALGFLGVILPLLPTTPFLLLAAACFMRSSDRLYWWLLTNRVFGEYLRRYREGEGIPLSTKIITLVFLWGTLATSAFLAISDELWWVRLILLAVGIGVTTHIVRIKTATKQPPS